MADRRPNRYSVRRSERTAPPGSTPSWPGLALAVVISTAATAASRLEFQHNPGRCRRSAGKDGAAISMGAEKAPGANGLASHGIGGLGWPGDQ